MAEGRRWRQGPRGTEAGTQLALLESEATSWRLDDQTREVGRRGVAEARAALRLGRRGHDGEHRPQRAEAA